MLTVLYRQWNVSVEPSKQNLKICYKLTLELANDAFYMIGSAVFQCTEYHWTTKAIQKIFYFSFFKVLAGPTLLTWTPRSWKRPQSRAIQNNHGWHDINKLLYFFTYYLCLSIYCCFMKYTMWPILNGLICTLRHSMCVWKTVVM
jgi:hypothetical protein